MTGKLALKLILSSTVLIFLLFFPATLTAQSGTIYYVDPAGDDNNDGLSESTPFATVQHCANLAQAGDTCRLREGLYREQIRPANSGTAGQPITFAAYPGETPLISGLHLIEENTANFGAWTQHSNSIYKIQLPADYPKEPGTYQLFVNGEKFIEARWPNMPHPTSIERADFAISTAGELGTDLGNDEYQSTYWHPGVEAFWDSGYISFSGGKEWWGRHGEIVSAEAGQVSFRFDTGGPSSVEHTIPSADDPFFLWGRLEALDAPGEFHLDLAGDYGPANTLYLYATESPASQQVEIKVDGIEHWLNYGFDVSGRSYIDVRGLHFKAARIASNADSQFINIDRIHSEYSGLHWMLGTWSPAPVDLHGENMHLTNAIIAHSPTAAVRVEGRDNLVENNVMYDLGYIINLSDGVQTNNTVGSVIRHNTIFDTKAIAISFARLQAGAVTHNRVYNIARRTTDIAAINSWNGGDGQNTQVAYNLVHDVLAYYEPDTEHWGGKGIRLDSGGSDMSNSNYIIHHNVVFNTTANGLAFWGVEEPDQPNYNDTGIQVYNNTVQGDIQLIDREGMSHQGMVIQNNLLTGKYSFFGSTDIPAGATVSHNFFAERDDLPNNLSGNPHLVSPANFNFTLRANSPAIDAGTTVPPFTDGYLGSQPDMGAYEFGQKPFVAGALLLPEHLSQLSVTCTAEQCTLTGLPTGYHVPFDFVLRLGDLEIDTCTNGLDMTSNSYYALCPVDLSPGEYPVSVSLDGNDFTDLGQTVGIEAMTVTAINPAEVGVNETATITISGTRFIDRADFKTPFTLENLAPGDLTERPAPIVIDTAQLISGGYLAEDCSDLAFVNAQDEPIFHHWLESGCNTERTLIWLKQKTFAEMPARPYHINFAAESGLFITRSDTAQSDLAAVYPVLASSANALWLASNDLPLADGAPIPNWPSRVPTDLVTVAQSEPAAQASLSLNQVNGWPSVFFDGGTDDDVGDTYHLGDTLGGDTFGGVFIVYHNPDPGTQNWQRIYSAGPPEDGPDYEQDAAFYIPPVLDGGVIIPQTTPTLHRNHYPSTTWDGTPRDPTDFRNFRLAQHNQSENYYRGYLTELIAFTEDISRNERDVVEQYLTAKYNLAEQNLRAQVAYTATLQPLRVEIGGQACLNVTRLSDNQLTCDLPPSDSAGLVAVSVTNALGESDTLADAFAYTDTPPVSGELGSLGGTLVFTFGNSYTATLTLPTGVLSETAVITYSLTPPPTPAPQGSLAVAGWGFQLSGYYLQSGQPFTQVNGLFTLQITNPLADWSGFQQGTGSFAAPSGVVYVWQADSGLWLPAETQCSDPACTLSLNPGEQTLTFSLDYLGQFGLFGVAPALKMVYLPLVLR